MVLEGSQGLASPSTAGASVSDDELELFSFSIGDDDETDLPEPEGSPVDDASPTAW